MKLNRLINRAKLAFISDETILDRHNESHWILIDEMLDALYEIWEYSKLGNAEALDFMHSRLHDRLVQFRINFASNYDIPEVREKTTYGAYKAIMEETMEILRKIRKERATA